MHFRGPLRQLLEPRRARRCVSAGNVASLPAQAPGATSGTEPGEHPEALAVERGHPAFPETLARRRGRGLRGRNRGAPPISERRAASAGPRPCTWHGRSLPGDRSTKDGGSRLQGRKRTTGRHSPLSLPETRLHCAALRAQPDGKAPPNGLASPPPRGTPGEARTPCGLPGSVCGFPAPVRTKPRPCAGKREV